MGNNLKDITEGRLKVVRDNNKRNVLDTLAIDSFIIEIFFILFFVVFELFTLKKYLGNALNGEDIIRILNNSTIPIFIFVIFTTLISIFKLIINHINKTKELKKFYIITLSFNVIFSIMFICALLLF